MSTGLDPTNRIIPRNLTGPAAAYSVVGNPPSTRPESGVGNCYPGLEYDHRNLDRRFLAGLEVEYVTSGSTEVGRDFDGALVRAATGAPGSALARLGAQLATGDWYLSEIAQGGRTIALGRADGDGGWQPWPGEVVWRLVRSLLPAEVIVTAANRRAVPAHDGPQPDGVLSIGAEIEIAGERIRYTDPVSEVIVPDVLPGELTQSLCSPWTHDFRDCSCTYWASNHPDIVLPALPPDQATTPGGGPTDPVDATPIDWLRAFDRHDEIVVPLPNQRANRPTQVGYFEINHRWQELPMVLERRERTAPYVPRSNEIDQAPPFDSPEELVARVRELAGLEHLIALVYLYAHSSVRPVDDLSDEEREAWPVLAEDVAFARAVLIDVAVGEMQHLRWVNQLLWGLAKHLAGPGGPTGFTPQVVPPASALPPSTPSSGPLLAPLGLAAVRTFIALESSSAYIDGAYSRVVATLLQPEYPATLYQLASQIARDGEQHHLDFLDLEKVIEPYAGHEELIRRDLVPGDPADADVREALELYHRITEGLEAGYHFEDPTSQRPLATSRDLMFDLLARADRLATGGVGIPYLS